MSHKLLVVFVGMALIEELVNLKAENHLVYYIFLHVDHSNEYDHQN